MPEEFFVFVGFLVFHFYVFFGGGGGGTEDDKDATSRLVCSQSCIRMFLLLISLILFRDKLQEFFALTLNSILLFHMKI